MERRDVHSSAVRARMSDRECSAIMTARTCGRSPDSVRGATHGLPAHGFLGESSHGLFDSRGKIGKPLVIETDVEVAELQVQASVFAAIDAAIFRFAQHFVFVVAACVIAHQ